MAVVLAGLSVCQNLCSGAGERALATLVFVKAGWLPPVVRDSDRKKHIDALESADGGDLKPLVSFFSGLQRGKFIRAVGIARDIEPAGRVDAPIEAIRRRVARRRDALKQEWQAAVSTAGHLHALAKERLEEVGSSLEEAMKGHAELSFFVDDEEDEGARSHYFQRQMVSTARKLRYYANPRHYRSWARLVARDGNQCNILIAFHCIGHEFQGGMACSGTWFLRVRAEDGGFETAGETALGDEVFQVSYKEDMEDVRVCEPEPDVGPSEIDGHRSRHRTAQRRPRNDSRHAATSLRRTSSINVRHRALRSASGMSSEVCNASATPWTS